MSEPPVSLAYTPSPLRPGVIRRGYTECRYGQLHYVRAAPAQGGRFPTLVLLHQNPSSWFEYKALIEAMATDREVIAFDTPGNGMSDGLEGPMSMTGYAAAFADGMEALGLGRDAPVDVFGFHTGTYLATELALAQPEKVGRVVLSGIPFRAPEERLRELEKVRATPAPTEDGEALFTRLRWMWNFLVTERDPRVPIQRAADLFIERARPLHRYWWPYDGVWSYPAEKRLPMLDQEVLVLQVNEALLEASRNAVKLFKRGRIVELPELSRDIFEPEVGVPTLAAHMREFLT